MIKIVFKLYLLFGFGALVGQIPQYRLTDWSKTGNLYPIHNTTQINIKDFGGKALLNFNNDTAIKNAIDFLKNNKGGTIFFDEGIFLFNNTITLSDSITLKGNGNKTIFQFNLNGASKNCINVYGNIKSLKTTFQSAKRGAYQLKMLAGNMPLKNDVIQLFQNDSALAFSSWAYGSIGQLCKVKSCDSINKTIELLTPLRLEYKTSSNTFFKILKPIQNISIECLKIIRLDTTTSQTHNIHFNYAFNCQVKGIESENCNFGHLVFDNSLHNEVIQSYIHHAFAYGSGGQGYGAVMQATSSDNKVENNIFNNLRHSNLMQSGANGNVISYNYSINPYWTDNALTNAAGDLVCHGNYAHSNLFEGNICQNIVVDNSHGKNGPYNTFFRNRAELYGIVTNVQDSQNYMANEITNTTLFMGQYIVGGAGNFALKNNIKGTLQASNLILNESSLYLKGKPNFFNTIQNFPAIGFPTVYNGGKISALTRYADSTEKIFCYTPATHSSNFENINTHANIKVYPNPFSEILNIELENGLPISKVIIYTLNGCKIIETGEPKLDTQCLKSGIYLLSINDNYHQLIIKQ